MHTVNILPREPRIIVSLIRELQRPLQCPCSTVIYNKYLFGLCGTELLKPLDFPK